MSNCVTQCKTQNVNDFANEIQIWNYVEAGRFWGFDYHSYQGWIFCPYLLHAWARAEMQNSKLETIWSLIIVPNCNHIVSIVIKWNILGNYLRRYFCGVPWTPFSPPSWVLRKQLCQMVMLVAESNGGVDICLLIYVSGIQRISGRRASLAYATIPVLFFLFFLFDDSGMRMTIFIGPESDHWLCLSLTHSLTHSLTP